MPIPQDIVKFIYRRNTYKTDFRNDIKVRPEDFNVCCPKCGANASMHKPAEPILEDHLSGGQSLKEGAKRITGPTTGHLSCLSCGMNKDNATINWPEDAFYQFDVRGGTVWAWNKDYLVLLRKWIGSDIKNENEFFDLNKYPDPTVRWAYIHFLANLPKFMVLKKNRALILSKIDSLLT